jgi:hypothetical protein
MMMTRAPPERLGPPLPVAALAPPLPLAAAPVNRAAETRGRPAAARAALAAERKTAAAALLPKALLRRGPVF